MSAQTDRWSDADSGGGVNGGRQGFAAAVAQLAVGWVDEQVETELLQTVTDGAVQVIPGSEDAAIVILAGPGLMAARSVHGSLPPAVMGLQNEVGEGPCLDALSRPTQVRIDDLPADPRWPRFAAPASGWGIRSMLCTPLVHQQQILGALCIASSVPDAFDDDALAMIDIFATHAVIALAGTRDRAELITALDSRDLVGQAKGILMERHHLSAEKAFAVLVRVSQDNDTTLRAVCTRLCLSGDLEIADATPARG